MQSAFVKLVIVGDTNVGKTSLVNRYVEDAFSDNLGNTVGVDFFACKMQLFGQTHTVQLWDTAGQERFKSVVKCYFKSASGVLMIFDLTQRESYKNIESWLVDIDDNINPSTAKVLVGNKADLTDNRVVSYEEAREYAESKKMMYFETSAKSALGVDVLFESIVKSIVENMNANGGDQTRDSTPSSPIRLGGKGVNDPKPPAKSTSGCCNL